MKVKGAADGKEVATVHHLYAEPRAYTIAWTSDVDVNTGSCASSSGTFHFTLGHVSTQLTLAALGDSDSSGEGTLEYYTDSGACDRSPDAWPRLIAISNPAVMLGHQDFLACSGATSKALSGKVDKQPDQLKELAELRPRPTLITMTIGGNDTGFSKVLADCYLENCIRDGTLKKASAAVDDEQTTLVADYRQLLKKDPSAAILIAGYPRIFEQDHFCGVKWLGLGFKPAALAGLNELAAKVDVSYIDVTNALAGHELCSKAPRLYAIDLRGKWINEEGHPTIPRQKALAAIVRSYIDARL